MILNQNAANSEYTADLEPSAVRVNSLLLYTVAQTNETTVSA